MAKDFAAIYASGNDAIALEQKIFLKEETTRGTLVAPTATDVMLANTGASVNFTQPVESSPVRSGRHHTNIIKQKTETTWTLPSFFHIDSSLGSASDAEIDLAYRLLWKSMLGKEAIGPLTYTSAVAPDTTFSIFNNGDQWALQSPGAFVQGANVTLPGDGDATVEFSGDAKTAYLIGIGKSNISNNTGNTITVQTGEGKRFVVGGMVMLIEADGTTRSADTPDGSPRTITDVTGDVITVDGAVLADADFSVTDGYLCYYEPSTSTGINDPQTGLQGSVTVVGLTTDCVRSVSFNMTNNHEMKNFCYGEAGLGGNLFTPGDRLTVEVGMELNLNHDLVEFLNKVSDFTGEDLTVKLGDPSGRHAEFTLPKVIFPRPEISVPDTGTIPISFTGNAYQSALDAADELTLKFL